MLSEKKEVIKHSAAIQIENKATLLQRKTWNVLFANAYDELPTKHVHRVNVRELMNYLGYTSNNQAHLKKSIKGLVTAGVEWNLLEKDKVIEWGVTTLLAQAKIKDGICTYAYSPEMRERLYNPTMYAKINLALQNRFSTKHALALFELFHDYFDESRQYGETPWIEVDRFRKLMGIPKGRYKEFKILNKWVVKDPVKEIQAVTDYIVEVEYKTERRKVVAVKFRVHLALRIPNEPNKPEESFVNTEGLPDVVAKLVKVGVHRNKAMRIWRRAFQGMDDPNRSPEVTFDDYVQEKLDLLDAEVARGNVLDEAAWLVAAIRDNYTNPTLVQQHRAQAAKEREKKRAERERQKDQIQKEYEAKTEAIFRQIIDETPDIEPMVDDILGVLYTKSPHLKQWHESDKSALENCNDHPALLVGVKRQLREKFPEHFQGIEDEYQTRCAAIDREIEPLKR